MPNRFPTEAANAPFLVEDRGAAAGPRELPGRITPTPKSTPKSTDGSRSQDAALEDEARPGVGENQAGFLKDTEPR